MSSRTVVFELLTYWHVGSGRGAAALADAVVARDDAGLPLIPGRTVKGLLRDAMELAAMAGAIPVDRVLRWFGSPIPVGEKDDSDEREQQMEKGRYATEPGLLWFGSAVLPESWTEWARGTGPESVGVKSSLFDYVASTGIDGEGVAREHTLRVREVAVPMTLRATVHGPEGDDAWVRDLEQVVPLLRCLGTRRQRGLGRVRVTVEAP